MSRRRIGLVWGQQRIAKHRITLTFEAIASRILG